MKGAISSFRVPYLAVLLAAACGSSTITNPNGADAPIVFPDAPIGTLDARVTCTSAIDCGVGQVCNPATSRCASNVACNMHMDCGNQAYCNNHVCTINMLRGPCDTSANCISDETCTAGVCGCNGQVLTATVVAPNVVIAVDRSDSMVTNNVPGTNPTASRWTVAKRTLQSLTAMYNDTIRFGLVLWPGVSQGCNTNNDHMCQGIDVAVNVGPMTATPIANYINSNNTGTCMLTTPIANSLTQLDTYAGFNDPTRANYLVLMTDGQENCAQNVDTDPVTATMALRNHNPEIRTFAVGFGGDVNATLLSNIATQGGTARSGTPKYYQADNEQDLVNAFASIAGAVASCDYTISMQTDDPTKVFVFLNAQQVARDPSHQSGWDFNPATQKLTFYGNACNMIKAGTAGTLSVSFGCPVIG